MKKGRNSQRIDRMVGAAIYVIFSFAFSAVFGAILSAAGGDIVGGFWRMTKAVFLFFGAPAAVAGGLLVVTSLPSNAVFGFGPGMYYGTVVLMELLRESGVSSVEAQFIFAVSVVSMVSYIVWLKLVKPGMPNW